MKNKKALSVLLAMLLVLSFVTFAFAAEQPAGGETETYWWSGLVQFLPIILIVLVFYFVLIRPENKRKKETANMRDNLKVGDVVTTIGGIVGRITTVRDEEITLESSSDRTKLRFKKWAISSVDKASNKNEEAKEEKQD